MREIKTEDFGQLQDGRAVRAYRLQNGNGLTARLIDYGAILAEFWTPDAQGNSANIVCGFDSLEQYLQPHPYFGATVGRYANRIAKGRFTLEGNEYTLAINNGPNHLHGGLKGFDKQLWKGEALPSTETEQRVQFSYRSKDGEEGYPGNLDVTVAYTLTEENQLVIEYTARTDKTTVLNLTNHSYFNLAGSGDILGHEMQIYADAYTPVDDALIPTGETAPVSGTPLDFREPKAIGSRISAFAKSPGGYDHNFVLRAGGKGLELAARAHEPKTGRSMEVRTTQPGMQFYTGNFLNGTLKGIGGATYHKHSAFCLETQHFPDSPNQPAFPSTVLQPGDPFRSTTIYTFLT
ncbi:MAG TPA: aldose epimerase family protein [Verrucomicrobiae bacterium]|nr:aldose epimerase family protein [Verrucomicrobiae bacterium]